MRIEFTGSNGLEIMSALQKARKERNGNRKEELEYNPEYSGSALSIDVVYPDGQRRSDTWRVPVGYFMDVSTGAVTNADGEPQDYDALVALS